MDEVPATEVEKVEVEEINVSSRVMGEEEVEPMEVERVQKMPMPKRAQGRRQVPPPMKK